ncbi:non-ribosomal peptide synthetase [Streptomyces sp. 021-4]|uniref:non-ribosomal peptide synthetase n=1 Tax=Streptomyces sp. 021-4 TaxID=2789260 RepID=UPI0039F50FF4
MISRTRSSALPGGTDTGPAKASTHIAEHRVVLPRTVEAGLRAAAAAAGCPLATVLRAVHLAVLRQVAGRPDVVSGLVLPGPGEPVEPVVRVLRTEVPDADWHTLVRHVATAEASEPSEVTETEGACDTVLDLSQLDGEDASPLDAEGASRLDGEETPGRPRTAPAGDREPVATWVRWEQDAGALTLRVRPAVDAAPTAIDATRLGGYTVRAAAALAADPGAPHDARSLLSAEETEWQLSTFLGRAEPLPADSFLDVLAERVRRHPDDLAVAHGGDRWSYRRLDERSDQVARGLRAHGVLGEEEVVGVVMDRSPEWIAAVLGILKAGGVYLPARPDFPGERTGRQFRRGECRVVLTDHLGASAEHRQVAARVEEAVAACPRRPAVVTVRELVAASGSVRPPDTPSGPGRLAYVYFTSGSTGEPKGAMIEHGSLLNHLLAKIEDLGIGPGDVVAQTAPACFDISFWQIFAPLLVGGSTRIVDADTQLDIARFLDEVEHAGVRVMQLVPSYLDVLLAHVEREPRRPPSLRAVSVTGEALKPDLARRWFAAFPGIPLVNAYGATEVADDTMHEILVEPPRQGFISVGGLLRNVYAYVLDDRLRPAPLGAPGQIAFAGICVGRGYINDEERTARAFVPDPARPGTRMYLTGDIGRWLPDGRIEFLGRRDQQVKIQGFRIETGEVENRMLGVPGVREAAVVVDASGPHDKSLVAFYLADGEVTGDDVRAGLVRSLPDYMVPTRIRRLDAMPLTANGKVDRLRLARQLTSPSAAAPAGGGSAPATPTELRLAAAWGQVLGLPVERIGRDDHFFELGGTSLAAVRLVAAVDRLVTLREVVGRPVLRELAALADERADAASA